MTCLTYLLLDDLTEDFHAPADLSKFELDDHPFLPYAANCWGLHYLKAYSDEMKPLAEKLLLDDRKIATACSHMYSEQSRQCLHDYNALHVAAFFGSMELAEMALSGSAADINLQSDVGQTPLSIACRAGSLSLVRMILQVKDVDVNAGRGSAVGTALHSAAASVDPVLVKELLTSGADVNARSAKQYTALHVAAEAGDLITLDLLLEAGSEANATSVAGTTALYRNTWNPLHEAVQCDQAGMAGRLLMYGADMSIRTLDGETALDMALALGRTEIGNMILNVQRRPSAQRPAEPIVNYSGYGPTPSSLYEQSWNSHSQAMTMDPNPPKKGHRGQHVSFEESRFVLQSELGASDHSSRTKTKAPSEVSTDYYPGVETSSRKTTDSLQDAFRKGPTTAIYEPKSSYPKPYICLEFGCHFRTARGYELKRHMKSHIWYTPGERYECSCKGCPRVGMNGFKRKDRLDEHVRNSHTGKSRGHISASIPNALSVRQGGTTLIDI